MEDSLDAPPEPLVNNIIFILNNLSSANIESKAIEVKNLVLPQYITWFVNHIIMKRVTSESAFHTFYVHLLETLEHPNLEHIVLQHIIITAGIFLNKQPSSHNISAIKNIGFFLGKYTSNRNIPLPLCLQNLLSKSNTADGVDVPMDNLVPFICKTLESTPMPLDPFATEVLRNLKEIHEHSKLQSIQFEIELLFLKLKLPIESF